MRWVGRHESDWKIRRRTLLEHLSDVRWWRCVAQHASHVAESWKFDVLCSRFRRRISHLVLECPDIELPDNWSEVLVEANMLLEKAAEWCLLRYKVKWMQFVPQQQQQVIKLALMCVGVVSFKYNSIMLLVILLIILLIILLVTVLLPGMRVNDFILSYVIKNRFVVRRFASPV